MENKWNSIVSIDIRNACWWIKCTSLEFHYTCIHLHMHTIYEHILCVKLAGMRITSSVFMPYHFKLVLLRDTFNRCIPQAFFFFSWTHESNFHTSHGKWVHFFSTFFLFQNVIVSTSAHWVGGNPRWLDEILSQIRSLNVSFSSIDKYKLSIFIVIFIYTFLTAMNVE